ncbi:hypothetical protein JNB11_07605 [Kocuria palustris]|nr:hypothetical protein [Kocuria palustris]
MNCGSKRIARPSVEELRALQKHKLSQLQNASRSFHEQLNQFDKRKPVKDR